MLAYISKETFKFYTYIARIKHHYSHVHSKVSDTSCSQCVIVNVRTIPGSVGSSRIK